MVERVGLAEHHILEYLRLGFGDEGEIIRLGQLPGCTTLIRFRAGQFYTAGRFPREGVCITCSRFRHLAIIMDREIGPVGRGKSGLETSGQIVIPLIGMFRLARAAAAEDIGAFIHRRQYRSAGQIEVRRGSGRTIVGIGRTRIIALLRHEAIQFLLRGSRRPIRNGADLVRGGSDSELFERGGIEGARPRKPGLRLKGEDRLSRVAAGDPVQSPGIEAAFCKDRLSFLRDRVVAGGLGGSGQRQSYSHRQRSQQSIPRSIRHDTLSR